MNAVLKQSDLPDPEIAGGWKASLDLEFVSALRNNEKKTVLSNLAFNGPLRVQRAFYPEGDVCHVYVLHPPGGVVGGDGLNIQVHMLKHAHGLLTTPGATKFYRSAGETAFVKQTLSVCSDACLEWFPHENIFFPGARAKIKTTIDLQGSSRLFTWEINCLGRPVNKEVFDSGVLDSRLTVSVEGSPLLLERQKVDRVRHLGAAAGLRDYPMQATMLVYKVSAEQLENVQAILANQQHDVVAGASLLDGLLVIRALGHRAEHIQSALISVWDYLRPVILKKPVYLPRIWAT